MKDELGGKIVKLFQVCHKRKLKFKDYKSCIKATKVKNKINHLE